MMLGDAQKGMIYCHLLQIATIVTQILPSKLKLESNKNNKTWPIYTPEIYTP